MQVMLCQSDLILLHKWGLDDSQSHTTVSNFENYSLPGALESRLTGSSGLGQSRKLFLETSNFDSL